MLSSLGTRSPASACSPHQLYQLSLQASLQLRQAPTPAHLQLRANLQALKDRLTPPERDLLRRSLLSTLALGLGERFTAAIPAQIDAALQDLPQAVAFQA